jgi:hypothetical protein
LLQVCGARDPDAINVNPAGFEFRSPRIRRLWPRTNRSFVWTNSPAVVASDFEKFSTGIYDTVQAALNRERP